MVASSGVIPNFINGVSQQPAAVRLPTQLESQVNGLSTITEGLRKRPPSVHKAILTGFPTSAAKYHTINRDTVERYKVAITDRDIDVVDLAGTAKTVNFATATFESLLIRSKEVKSIVDAVATGSGTGIQVDMPTGLTVMRVVTSGITTATVLVQESIIGDFSDATTAATITTNTTTSVTVTSGYAYRCRVSAWTSGTVDATMYFPYVRYGGNGISRKLVTPSGTTDLDVITAGSFTGTILLQQSTTGAWAGEETTAATITTATTTPVTITSGYYYRCKVTAWTGVTTTDVTATLSWKDASYVNTTDPNTDLKMITVADHTFVLNKEVTTAVLATKSAERNPQALVHVVAGNYENTYKILIDGAVVAEYVTEDGSSPAERLQTSPANIAKALFGGATSPNGMYAEIGSDGVSYTASSAGGRVVSYLEQNLTEQAGWAVTRYNNVLHIENVNGTDFTISTEGNNSASGTTSIRAHKDTEKDFSDLPNSGPHLFAITIVGDEKTDFDDYHVQFEANTGGTSSRGVWKETIAPDTLTSLDAGTLPHTLVREADGTFTFKSLTWDDRAVGDLTSVPWPSFIGSAGQSLLFFKNRFGLSADENTILSRAGSFYNMFPASVTAQLDSDPIDVAISHPKVSIINHSVVYNENLLLFSGLTQFRLSGDEILTPTSANNKPLTEYRVDIDVEPVVCGTSVFFAVNNEKSTTMREFVYDERAGIKDGPSITDHCIRFLPVSISQIACNGHLNMLALLSPTFPSRIYVYKYYWSNNEKLQSAWSYWDLGSDATVLDADFIDNDLSIVVARTSDTAIEHIPCEEGYRDVAPDLTVHLDRRVDTADASPSYAAGPDQTTFSLPYAANNGTEDVIVVNNSGALIPVVSVATNDVVVAGDESATTGWIGFIPSEFRARLSEFIPKERSRGNYADAQALPVGDLVVRTLTLTVGRTGYFTVEVGQSYRDTFTHTFTGATLGDADNLIGSPAFDWQSWRVPIMAKAGEVAVDLVSDSYLPCSFLNGEWQGNLYRRR